MTTPTTSDDGKRGLESSVGELLAADHEQLERLFQSLVAAAAGDGTVDLHPSWQVFERILLRHLDAEEAHLIGGFRKQYPEQAEELLRTHEQIRAKLVEMGIDLDLHALNQERVETFVAELRDHARREERLLYPWAADQLGVVGRTVVRQALATASGAPAYAPRQQWRIDLARSTLRFSLRHLVVGEVRGAFGRWGGTLWLDPMAPPRSRVEVWIDLGSIGTGDRARDEHVRSPEFFDVARFPQASFTSTEVTLPEPECPVVRGSLTLNGREQDVEVAIRELPSPVEGEGGERARYRFSAQIDRREFGLRWNQDLDVGGIVVGDLVDLEGEVELERFDPGTRLPR